MKYYLLKIKLEPCGALIRKS